MASSLRSFRFLAMTTIPANIGAIFLALFFGLYQELFVILFVCHLWIISDNNRMHRVEYIPKVVPKREKSECVSITIKISQPDPLSWSSYTPPFSH